MFIRPSDALTRMIQAEFETTKESQQDIQHEWLRSQDDVDAFVTKDGAVQATAAVAVVNAGVVVGAIVAGFAMKNAGKSIASSKKDFVELQGISVNEMSLDALLSLREKQLK